MAFPAEERSCLSLPVTLLCSIWFGIMITPCSWQLS